MNVTFNEEALTRLATQIIQSKAEEVTGFASDNVSGSSPSSVTAPLPLGVRTGLLQSSVRFVLDSVNSEAVVGSDATNRGFSYPAYWELQGRSWLSDALIQAGFRRA